MDKPGLSSRESDKITQMEARTRAFGRRRRIYMECTVSTENGRTWQDYSKGTRSRIALRCPACRQWVSPEREHLTGWQGAQSQVEARSNAAFACPACGECWSDSQRVQANTYSILLHDGQTVTGEADTPIITGEPSPTDTLGFRWSAVNNLFLTAGDIAADEWRASRAADEDSAERELRQFVWCIPVVPPKLAQTSLEIHELAARMTDAPKGIVPANMPILTAGVDLGKYLFHWVVVAWTPQASGHIVDYGRLEVASESLGVERAVMVGLREMKDFMLAGWPAVVADGQRLQPARLCVDAGYMTDVVYTFCREAGERFRPAFGRGAGQQYRQQWAERTTQTGSTVKLVGEGCHVSWLPVQQLHIIEADADHWKTWVHQRLSTPIGNAGAMTLYRAAAQDHLSLAKHLTAEVKTEEFVAGKGVVTKWERIRRQNHWFDALYNSCVAAHGCGVKLVQEMPALPPAPPSPPVPRDSEEKSWIERSEVSNWLHRYKGTW